MVRLLAIMMVFVISVFAADYTELISGQNNMQFSIQSSDRIITKAAVSFPGIYLEDIKKEGINFHKLQMPQMSLTIEEGFPEVPQIVKFVGIDFSGEYQVRLIDAEYVEINDVNVFPAQPRPTRLDEELPWRYNKEFYTSNAWYPESVVAAEKAAGIRNYRVLPVQLRPVQFNPAERKIRIAKTLTFQVERISDHGENEITNFEIAESPAFTPLYEKFIENFSSIRKENTPGINGMPDMLIITHDAYYNSVLPFADWKNQKGIETTIVKKSEIGSNATANQIKTYIQNYYDTATDKPDYLLIVGDVQGANPVPWFSVGSSKSDMPYYYLVGNDLLADISGGRISVQTTAEADIVFEKLIRYEKNPYTADPNWFQSAFVINSNDFQDPTAGYWAKDKFTNYGFNPVHHIGDNLGNATVANVYNAVNSGVSYIYYIGHGAPTYWVTTGFSTTHIPALTNGEMQPVISSVACNNADLDEPNDVFAETWLKNSTQNGSVGIMAFTESCDVYTTDTLARGMVRAVLSDTITAFGNIIDYGRLHMFQNYGTGCSEPMHQSILIGEPELQVWTKTPEVITANMPAAAFLNIPFTVQVTGTGGPIENALVCYWDSLGNTARGYTDGNGEIILNHGVSTPVTGKVTITGHNLLTVQNSIEVLPPNGPYVMAKNLEVLDVNGNHNLIAEAGEQVELNLMLHNIGVDSAENVTVGISSADTNVTILSGNHNFGKISADSMIVGGNFQVQLSPNCPHLHAVRFTIDISADGGHLWSQDRYLQVRKGAVINLPVTQINFDDTYLNFTSQKGIPVINDGPDTLWITDVLSDSTQFAINPAQFWVAPGEQKQLQVEFTPDTTKLYSAIVTIKNTDPVNFVTTFAVSGTGIYSPAIGIPDSLQFAAQQNDSLNQIIQIENNGLGELVFNTQVSGYNPNGDNRGSGGADTYGHIWIDSDESGGPVYDWMDISTTGTPVSVIGNNAISNSLDIGFDFTFYGQSFNKIRVCTNGWMSFTTFSVAYNNFALPSNLAPRSMVAPLWDDLNMTAESSVYIENMGNKFVVQCDSFYRVTGEGPFTFQSILYDNGNIKLQYNTLDSLVSDYTVGIQNHNADDGLTIAHNENYLHENLAILISKHSWLAVNPMSGVIPAQSSMDLDVIVKTNSFPMGDFWASIEIESNDPGNPVVQIPVHLQVGLTGIADNDALLPKTVQLSQNYPNPFNPTTQIRFALPAQQQVQLTIFNMLGQKVKTILYEDMNAGLHEVVWDGKNANGVTVGSGIYVYQLEVGNTRIQKKMMLMK